MKPRVFYDAYGLTTAPLHGYLGSKGLTPMLMAYDRDVPFPGTPEIMTALAKRAYDHGCMLVLDIERPEVAAMTRAEQTTHFAQLLTWVRENEYGPQIRVGLYQQPSMSLARFNALSVFLDAAVSCFYSWDLTILNRDYWFEQVDQYDTFLRREYPHLHRIATICPCDHVFKPAQTGADPARHGQPLPVGAWSRQLAYLRDRGWDLLVWTGGLPDTPAFRRLIDEAAKGKA